MIIFNCSKKQIEKLGEGKGENSDVPRNKVNGNDWRNFQLVLGLGWVNFLKEVIDQSRKYGSLANINILKSWPKPQKCPWPNRASTGRNIPTSFQKSFVERDLGGGLVWHFFHKKIVCWFGSFANCNITTNVSRKEKVSQGTRKTSFTLECWVIAVD